MDPIGNVDFSDITLYIPKRIDISGYSTSTSREGSTASNDFSLLVASSHVSIWPGGGKYDGQHSEMVLSSIVSEYNKRKKPDFSVKLNVETGTFVSEVFLRVTYFEDTDRHVFHARRQSNSPLPWRELNIAPQAQSELLHTRLCSGGLVVVCGVMGQGKTTVINSLISARIQAFGGVCITVEDPVEVPQPEFIVCKKDESVGHIMQREYDDPAECPTIIRETLRAYPSSGTQSILVVGECRDPETASLLLQSAIDGRLIITTVHANDPVSGLQRIASLAAKKIGDEAYNQMADAFRVSYHQALPLIDGVPTPISNFIVDTPKFAVLARERKWASMRQEYASFFSQLKTGGRPPVHRTATELRDGFRSVRRKNAS